MNDVPGAIGVLCGVLWQLAIPLVPVFFMAWDALVNTNYLAASINVTAWILFYSTLICPHSTLVSGLSRRVNYFGTLPPLFLAAALFELGLCLFIFGYHHGFVLVMASPVIAHLSSAIAMDGYESSHCQADTSVPSDEHPTAETIAKPKIWAYLRWILSLVNSLLLASILGFVVSQFLVSIAVSSIITRPIFIDDVRPFGPDILFEVNITDFAVAINVTESKPTAVAVNTIPDFITVFGSPTHAVPTPAPVAKSTWAPAASSTTMPTPEPKPSRIAEPEPQPEPELLPEPEPEAEPEQWIKPDEVFPVFQHIINEYISKAKAAKTWWLELATNTQYIVIAIAGAVAWALLPVLLHVAATSTITAVASYTSSLLFPILQEQGYTRDRSLMICMALAVDITAIAASTLWNLWSRRNQKSQISATEDPSNLYYQQPIHTGQPAVGSTDHQLICIPHPEQPEVDEHARMYVEGLVKQHTANLLQDAQLHLMITNAVLLAMQGPQMMPMQAAAWQSINHHMWFPLVQLVHDKVTTCFREQQQQQQQQQARNDNNANPTDAPSEGSSTGHRASSPDDNHSLEAYLGTRDDASPLHPDDATEAISGTGGAGLLLENAPGAPSGEGDHLLADNATVASSREGAQGLDLDGDNKDNTDAATTSGNPVRPLADLDYLGDDGRILGEYFCRMFARLLNGDYPPPKKTRRSLKPSKKRAREAAKAQQEAESQQQTTPEQDAQTEQESLPEQGQQPSSEEHDESQHDDQSEQQATNEQDVSPEHAQSEQQTPTEQEPRDQSQCDDHPEQQVSSEQDAEQTTSPEQQLQPEQDASPEQDTPSEQDACPEPEEQLPSEQPDQSQHAGQSEQQASPEEQASPEPQASIDEQDQPEQQRSPEHDDQSETQAPDEQDASSEQNASSEQDQPEQQVSSEQDGEQQEPREQQPQTEQDASPEKDIQVEQQVEPEQHDQPEQDGAHSPPLTGNDVNDKSSIPEPEPANPAPASENEGKDSSSNEEGGDNNDTPIPTTPTKKGLAASRFAPNNQERPSSSGGDQANVNTDGGESCNDLTVDNQDGDNNDTPIPTTPVKKGLAASRFADANNEQPSTSGSTEADVNIDDSRAPTNPTVDSQYGDNNDTPVPTTPTKTGLAASRFADNNHKQPPTSDNGKVPSDPTPDRQSGDNKDTPLAPTPVKKAGLAGSRFAPESYDDTPVSLPPVKDDLWASRFAKKQPPTSASHANVTGREASSNPRANTPEGDNNDTPLSAPPAKKQGLGASRFADASYTPKSIPSINEDLWASRFGNKQPSNDSSDSKISGSPTHGGQNGHNKDNPAATLPVRKGIGQSRWANEQPLTSSNENGDNQSRSSSSQTRDDKDTPAAVRLVKKGLSASRFANEQPSTGSSGGMPGNDSTHTPVPASPANKGLGTSRWAMEQPSTSDSNNGRNNTADSNSGAKDTGGKPAVGMAKSRWANEQPPSSGSFTGVHANGGSQPRGGTETAPTGPRHNPGLGGSQHNTGRPPRSGFTNSRPSSPDGQDDQAARDDHSCRTPSPSPAQQHEPSPTPTLSPGGRAQELRQDLSTPERLMQTSKYWHECLLDYRIVGQPDGRINRWYRTGNDRIERENALIDRGLRRGPKKELFVPPFKFPEDPEAAYRNPQPKSTTSSWDFPRPNYPIFEDATPAPSPSSPGLGSPTQQRAPAPTASPEGRPKCPPGLHQDLSSTERLRQTSKFWHKCLPAPELVDKPDGKINQYYRTEKNRIKLFNERQEKEGRPERRAMPVKPLKFPEDQYAAYREPQPMPTSSFRDFPIFNHRPRTSGAAAGSGKPTPSGAKKGNTKQNKNNNRRNSGNKGNKA